MNAKSEHQLASRWHGVPGALVQTETLAYGVLGALVQTETLAYGVPGALVQTETLAAGGAEGRGPWVEQRETLTAGAERHRQLVQERALVHRPQAGDEQQHKSQHTWLSQRVAEPTHG